MTEPNAVPQGHESGPLPEIHQSHEPAAAAPLAAEGPTPKQYLAVTDLPPVKALLSMAFSVKVINVERGNYWRCPHCSAEERVSGEGVHRDDCPVGQLADRLTIAIDELAALRTPQVKDRGERRVVCAAIP